MTGMPSPVREPVADAVADLVGDRFTAQVAARPDAVALVHDGRSLTYRELHAAASAVAGGLAALGVGRETVVGVAYGRSVESVVATLGVVLAGGAYVPVNPQYPPRRIAQVVALSGARVVIAAPSTRAAVAGAVGGGVIVLGVADLDGPAPATPPVRADRSPLCCVMYTSGSTGRPKGVMIEHRGVLRLVTGQDYLDFGRHHTFLHAAAPEFDAALFEVWGALLHGATLCVADQETAVVPWRYARALRDNGISVAWLTAPLFARMADEDPGMFAGLRVLLTGGDVVSPRHVAAVARHCPELLVCNGYGPTENTTFTSVYPVPRGHTGPLPVGRPIAGTTVLVRDERGAPVRPGTTGELLVGGAGLARGYLGQPALTRDRFVYVDGRRYYRTGDRVHQDSGGVLHFHGRWDDQVKVNGNLVELKEIVAALRGLPGVRDAFCRVAGAPGRDRYVAAYAVAPGHTGRALRAALAAALPGYLVPASVVVLDRFPLLDNGKVDAAALPEPVAAPAAPLTDRHRVLARLWAEVLDVPAAAIGPDSDFAELGGNSLRLGVLLGRIHRETGVRVPLRTAAAARTLDQLAGAVARGRTAPPPAIPAVSGAADLHPQQRGLYAIWHADPSSLAYNVPVRIGLPAGVDRDRLRSAFLSTVARHDALRMRFEVSGGVVRQRPVTGVEPEFGVDGPVAAFVRPFDPAEPVLPRALLTAGALYLDVHHVVFDGVSLDVVVRDLFGRQDGPAPRYADAAQWCHDQGVRAEDVRYWRRRLAGAPPLALPTDRPRGARRATAGALVRRVLPGGPVTRAAARHGVTRYVLLLAAYVATLARICGQRDVVVGSPASGRTHPALERTVGMFVNTVCLRAEFGATTTFGDLVGHVARRVAEALTHQAVPHRRIAEALGVPRDPARNPLFDVFFAVHDLGLHERRVELLNPGTTRFDLNLQIHPRGGELGLDLEYATALFDHASAEFLLGAYVAVLDELLAAPHAPAVPARPGSSPVALAEFDL